MIAMILKLIGKRKGLLPLIVEILDMERAEKTTQPENMEGTATGFETFEIKEESCAIYIVTFAMEADK